MKVGCEVGVISGLSEEKLLSQKLNRFWDLDTIGIADDDEKTCFYDKFIDEIKFENGRYKVRLPLKETQSMLPDNYSLSMKRLKSLKERLDKDEDLLKRYDDVIQEQLKLGFMEEVKQPGIVGYVTYLPQKEVIREEKSSTKLRVVFDGSAKVKNGVSLNDVLYKGPCMNPMLYDLLLKFRVYPIAITADIEKAYLQIVVEEDHRDYLRLLWFRDVFAKTLEVVKYHFEQIALNFC